LFVSTFNDIVDSVHVMLAKPAFKSRLSLAVMVRVPVYSVPAGLVRVGAAAAELAIAISAAAVARMRLDSFRGFITFSLGVVLDAGYRMRPVLPGTHAVLH